MAMLDRETRARGVCYRLTTFTTKTREPPTTGRGTDHTTRHHEINTA